MTFAGIKIRDSVREGRRRTISFYVGCSRGLFGDVKEQRSSFHIFVNFSKFPGLELDKLLDAFGGMLFSAPAAC